MLKHIKHSKKPHTLYLVALENEDIQEMFTKIGVTAYAVNTRFSNSNYKVAYAKEFAFPNGIQARGWESLLKEKLIPYDWKYYPNDKTFAGKTECYLLRKIMDIEEIMCDFLIQKKLGRKKKEIIPEINNIIEIKEEPALEEVLIFWSEVWEI